MNGIKKFVTLRIPVYSCNFRCMYCYVGQHKNAYTRGIQPMIKGPEYIAKFFSKQKTGGGYYFNCCADGETTLHPQLVELVCSLIKEDHFVDIITNGSFSKRFDEIIAALNDNEKKALFIKFSFHYLELQRQKLLDTFVQNVRKIKEAGISYTIEITPHDELVPYIDEIKEFSLKTFGALPHITVARNEDTKEIELLSKYSKAEYKKIWSVFDSELFNFKLSIFNEKRSEFCYAGLWSLNVNLETGDYYQCYVSDKLGSILDGIDFPIKCRPICKCRLPHCFNGHTFLAYGLCPDLETATYEKERNRICTDGSEFLNDETKKFFSSKLADNNVLLSEEEKKYFIKIDKQSKLKNAILHYPKTFARRLTKK